MTCVGILEIFTNPLLYVSNLGERIARCLFACVELRKTNTKAKLVHIGVRNNVISSGGHWWVDQEFNQALSGEHPALGVPVDKRL